MINSVQASYAQLMVFVYGIMCSSLGFSWHETTWNAAWDTWWHYKEGAIGGPSHWGQTAYMAYADDVWPACYKGKLQSPINISTANLTYDPSLQPLVIIGQDKQIDLEISNAGQDLRIDLLDGYHQIFLTGGPFSYEYKAFGALIKFGSKSQHGSDHQIDGVSFPAEIQLYAYNHVLYPNVSMAVPRPYGLAAIAIFLKLGDHPSADLSALLATAEEVQLKGQSRRLNGLLVSALLPSTKQYVTYQGSLPFPACHETVTWIVLNHAAVITETQLKALRELRMSPFRDSGRMSDNFRPVQNLNSRSVRTNINFVEQNEFCSMRSRVSYIASFRSESGAIGAVDQSEL